MTRNAIPDILGRHNPQLYADPAAGASGSFDPPDDQRSMLVALSFTFTADANVANRHVHVKHKVGIVEYTIGVSPAPIAATSITSIVVAPFLPIQTTVVGTGLNVAIAADYNFLDNASLEIEIINIQAGDQISDPRAIWRTWQAEIL